MAVLKTRQVDRALVNKLGFEKKSTHHVVYELRLKDRLVARTFVSHGRRELDRYLVGRMAKQLHLRQAEFWQAVECPLTQDDYHRLLEERLPDL